MKRMVLRLVATVAIVCGTLTSVAEARRGFGFLGGAARAPAPKPGLAPAGQAVVGGAVIGAKIMSRRARAENTAAATAAGVAGGSAMLMATGVGEARAEAEEPAVKTGPLGDDEKIECVAGCYAAR